MRDLGVFGGIHSILFADTFCAPYQRNPICEDCRFLGGHREWASSSARLSLCNREVPWLTSHRVWPIEMFPGLGVADGSFIASGCTVSALFCRLFFARFMGSFAMPVEPLPDTTMLRLWLMCLVGIALVHAPFLWDWGQWMWAREHYQFFPFIIIGFGWLLKQRVPQVQWPSGAAFSIRVFLYLAVSLILFAFASRAHSHWVGLIAFLSAFWTSVWLFGGRSAADQMRGPMFFLALLVPLPLNLDLQFIIGLQKVATWLASGVLDLRSVGHTVSGVVLKTQEKTFMVEEACSGVHSLFSAVTAMTFLAVYSRYGIPRLLLSVAQTVLWVLAANGLRVFLVVFCFSMWKVSLDTGWRHEALGVGTYLLVLIFALSTDQLLRFIFPLSETAIQAAREAFLENLIRPFNRFIAAVFDKPSLSGKSALVIPVLLASVVYLPLGAMAVTQGAFGSREKVDQSLSAVGSLDAYQESSLPEVIAGWRRSEFRLIKRAPDDVYGLNSAVWGYVGHGVSTAVSVDGFYSEWHDLAYCYNASGWRLQESRNFTVNSGDLEVPHTRLQLYKETGETAVVYFSCFDSSGAPVTPGMASGSVLRTLRDRLFSEGLGFGKADKIVGPVFQVQLLMESNQSVLPNEHDLLERLFRDVREKLRADFIASRK